MQIIQIPSHHVQASWPDVEPFISSALGYCQDEYSTDQIRMMLARGEHALLAAVSEGKIVGAAAITFEDYPKARVAFVVAIGGRLISNPSAWEQLRSWCVERGATKIRGAARPAVARLWKQKFGFEQRYIIVEHAL